LQLAFIDSISLFFLCNDFELLLKMNVEHPTFNIELKNKRPIPNPKRNNIIITAIRVTIYSDRVGHRADRNQSAQTVCPSTRFPSLDGRGGCSPPPKPSPVKGEGFARFPGDSIGKLSCPVNSPLTKQDSFNIILHVNICDAGNGYIIRKPHKVHPHSPSPLRERVGVRVC
jgi:hypothetical protein